MPTKCSGVPDSILNPANQWSDKADFDATLGHLADLYEVSSPAALRPNPFPARINLLPATAACRPLGTAPEVITSTSALYDYSFAPGYLPKHRCHFLIAVFCARADKLPQIRQRRRLC